MRDRERERERERVYYSVVQELTELEDIVERGRERERERE